jgi:hypothetical protein
MLLQTRAEAAQFGVCQAPEPDNAEDSRLTAHPRTSGPRYASSLLATGDTRAEVTAATAAGRPMTGTRQAVTMPSQAVPHAAGAPGGATLPAGPPRAGTAAEPAYSVLGRRCPCGARDEPDRPTCAKCQARVRWARRKARRSGIGKDP